MKINLLCFGITREIMGNFNYEIDIEEPSTVQQLKALLQTQFSDFQKLTSLRIAVNGEYGDENRQLKASDEIVLIPPVSGG